MIGECCQVTFLILVCLLVGFMLAVWLTDAYGIHGIPDLWQKFVDLFQKTKDRAFQGN